MSMPSDAIRDLLVEAGVGVFAATTGWSIRIGEEPDKPNTVISIWDAPGSPPSPNMSLQEPSVVVRVRGNPDDYPVAYAKAVQVRDVLHGVVRREIAGWHYLSIFAAHEPEWLGRDETRRPIFGLNFDIRRELA